MASQICPEADCTLLRQVHKDVTAIFSGSYPGFEESITKYHNLRHTHSVVLATIRLFHGLYHEQNRLPHDLVLQGLLSAYFHDSGMLPQSLEEVENDTGYTIHHEKRSIAILDLYLKTNNYPEEYRTNCATIIRYTMLDWEAEHNTVTDRDLHLCGQVVGTADLLAQMADRYYVESLPLLFQEHRDSGIDRHTSAIDLMHSTLEFHEQVIKRRLDQTLGNLSPAMRTHFRIRWQIDRNIYLDNIGLNLHYLDKITRDCSMDLHCWKKYLRRTPPPSKG
ncbi:MAG: hypothetical protein V2I36_12995 [Desulfopila sp.]|nr:hypothetical protein [Desulfopila sp.]